MRKILISSALILSLAGGASAFAATKPAPKAAPTAAASATDGKAADCTKQWKAEKKHSQTHKAFMAACAKG